MWSRYRGTRAVPECFLADVSIPSSSPFPSSVPILLFLRFVVVVAIIVQRTQRNEARSYRLLPVRRNPSAPSARAASGRSRTSTR